MKIFCNDSTNFKFSRMIIDHWISLGHEVDWELGANPEKAEQADIVFIDFLDNNFNCYFNNKTPIKKLVVRAIDIDVFMGRHRQQEIWGYLDAMICIAPHIQQKIESEVDTKGKLHLIPCGVNTNKFTIKPINYNNTIGIVCGDLWEMKNVIEGFRIFQLVEHLTKEPWKLLIRGQHNERDMEQIMKDHILFSNPRVQLIPQMEDIRDFYKQIDFLIVPSLKEAFSYATAEAMAMGIKPILNNWYGCRDIWPKQYIYNNLWEAAKMVSYDGYNQELYRHTVISKYDASTMFKQIDALLNL